VPKMLEHRRARERATEEGASRESGRATKVSKTTANGWEANENGSGRLTWRSDGDWGGRGWQSCSRG
jgi:hypothetical protein